MSSRPNAAAAVPALTSASAAVTDRYAYEAFGVLLEHTGSAPNPFLFTGAVADPASGLVDLRARWLHPRLGILLSRDPFPGLPDAPASLHPYLYAFARPTQLTDPSGRFAVSVAELQVTITSQITATLKVLNTAFTVLNVVDAIQDAYALARTLIRAWHYMSTYSTPEGALLALLGDFKTSAGITEIPNPAEVLGEVGEFIGERWEDLRRRIQRNAGFIGQKAAQALFVELGDVLEARARRAGNFIFYAPSPPGRRGRTKFADFPIGRQGGFEVALPLMGGGRLFGFGYRDRRTKSGEFSENQFFRIDYAEKRRYDPHCHVGSKRRTEEKLPDCLE